MSDRFSKHKYDIKKRPKQNELAEHCYGTHDPEKDLKVYILDHGIKELGKRELLEDKYICKLQTMPPPHGLNVNIHPYAKEMYQSWTSALQHQLTSNRTPLNNVK